MNIFAHDFKKHFFNSVSGCKKKFECCRFSMTDLCQLLWHMPELNFKFIFLYIVVEPKYECYLS